VCVGKVVISFAFGLLPSPPTGKTPFGNSLFCALESLGLLNARSSARSSVESRTAITNGLMFIPVQSIEQSRRGRDAEEHRRTERCPSRTAVPTKRLRKIVTVVAAPKPRSRIPRHA